MSEAPERIWMDPDIKFLWMDPDIKLYGCDIEYIRKDIHDDEITRLQALVAELEAADEGARQIIATERGEVGRLRKAVERLKAQVAAAYEDAAAQCADQFAAHMTAAICGEPDNSRTREAAANMADRLLHRIRKRTPDDAAAALDAMLERAVKAALKDAADLMALRCGDIAPDIADPFDRGWNIACKTGASDIPAIDPAAIVEKVKWSS